MSPRSSINGFFITAGQILSAVLLCQLLLQTCPCVVVFSLFKWSTSSLRDSNISKCTLFFCVWKKGGNDSGYEGYDRVTWHKKSYPGSFLQEKEPGYNLLCPLTLPFIRVQNFACILYWAWNKVHCTGWECACFTGKKTKKNRGVNKLELWPTYAYQSPNGGSLVSWRTKEIQSSCI